MVKPQQGQWVVPNPQIPRTFGWLNIIFGALMLLAGAYYIAMFFLTPLVTRTVQSQVESQLTARRQLRESEIAALKAKEQAAKTEAEKRELQKKRAVLESAVASTTDMFADIKDWNIYKDRRVAVYFWLEVCAGILLNVLMIAAGIGLLSTAEWARRLSVNVAWLKILRWSAMTILTLSLIVPITTDKIRSMYAKMDQQIAAKGGAGAMPFSMTSLAPIVGVFTALGTVANAVFASVYPALSIWYLTRPRSRAACLAKPAPAWSEPAWETADPG
jgi:hypothetical protein